MHYFVNKKQRNMGNANSFGSVVFLQYMVVCCTVHHLGFRGVMDSLSVAFPFISLCQLSH